MKQKDFQTIINKNFNNIPDSLINFSDVNECEFLADKLSFMGYGQNAEGYFKHGNVPNPSQKFHLAEAYFEYKFSKMKDKECFKDCELGRIRCPQLMLWIAEIVQIPESVLKDAYNYIVKNIFSEDWVLWEIITTSWTFLKVPLICSCISLKNIK